MSYDIFLAGVGGQGILTIGEILTGAAFKRGLPASFFPSKGMAQRGGFVKAQLRLGRLGAGLAIPEQGADLVIAMEPSEALKAVRYAQPEGDFVLFGDVWSPTAVLLGKQGYPSLAEIAAAIRAGGRRLVYLDPACLPQYQVQPAAANLFTLGAALGRTRLGEIFSAEELEAEIASRWRKAAEANIFAFRAGKSFNTESTEKYIVKNGE